MEEMQQEGVSRKVAMEEREQRKAERAQMREAQGEARRGREGAARRAAVGDVTEVVGEGST